MAEPDSERLSEIQSKIQSGLRVHARAQRRVQSVQLADDLSTVYEELDDAAIPAEGEVDDVSSFFSTTDRGLQRTRKAVEVVEDSLDIGLGHSKLARLAMTGAQLSSGVALVIATHNLLISANNLDLARASVESIQDIAAERFHNFYRAIGLFVAEAILFTTPFNYQIAWRGTRYLNNRFLYTLRHSGFSGPIDTAMKGLHRVVLSEIHYVIRGIVPTGLRAPGEFVTYLTSMATQTLALLWEFTDLGVGEIRGKAEAIVSEYRAFVGETYEVVTANVDVDAVIKNVVAQFRGEVDFFSLASPYQDPNVM
ncbi:hypothetical protein GLW36_14765 [Halorubrum terrestre]|uniref:Uncharacterized protein n=1 Tax=Halorubrum distributum TaxID=29283 RepID=A0A6B1IAN3_9EURY|nr:hypothetical protein [Halorubrum terrestre]MYL17902.1 hypothetical protein [Halorubrum terrestre]